MKRLLLATVVALLALAGSAAAAPNVTFEDSEVFFHPEQPGQTSPARGGLLNNSGTSEAVVEDVYINGPNAGRFDIQFILCGTIQPGGYCHFGVTMSPHMIGPMEATLTLEIAGQSNLNIPLRGYGGEAQGSSSAQITDLGDVEVGSSATRTIHITSTGTAPMLMYGAWPDISFEDASDPLAFQLSNDSCVDVELAPTESCSVDVTLSPGSVGPKRTRVVVDANSADETSFIVQGIGVVTPPTEPPVDPPVDPPVEPPVEPGPPDNRSRFKLRTVAPKRATAGRIAVIKTIVRNPMGTASAPVVIRVSGPKKAIRKPVRVKLGSFAPDQVKRKLVRLKIKPRFRGRFRAKVTVVANPGSISSMTRAIQVQAPRRR